ncbi:MAG TPA: hypothetical protein VF011_11685 [Terriglobales bacterium]
MMSSDPYKAKKTRTTKLLRENIAAARKALGEIFGPGERTRLAELTRDFQFSVKGGDLLVLDGHWYATHTGLIRLARRKKCRGIHVETVDTFCDSRAKRFVIKATVFPSPNSLGFTGYGDADPSNISSLVHGAEMRVAETRAVNRALRKAYGVGVCSVEERGSSGEAPGRPHRPDDLVPQPANGNGYGGPKVRDRLCQIIRQYQLNPVLVKSYAVDFCAVAALRDASREQVENFIAHLADWAATDRNALICQLNSYLGQKEAVA